MHRGRVGFHSILPRRAVQGCVRPPRSHARFDAFTPDNDLYGEHDCASLIVEGHRVLFKIDTYDADLRGYSPDPADARVTRRVMTIMLADEY